MLILSIEKICACLACTWLACFFQNPQEHYQKGKAEFYAGHYTECISELKLCVKDTAFKDCDYLIAMSYLNLGQYPAAIPYFRKVIGLHKEQYNAYMQLAACYHARRRTTKTNRIYHKLLRVQPAYYPAYFEEGSLEFEKGKYKKAIALYQQTLSFKPGFEKAFYQLGYCYLNLKDTAKACGYWSKIQDLDDFKNYQEIEHMLASYPHE